MNRTCLFLMILLGVSVSAFATTTTVGTAKDLVGLKNNHCTSSDTILITDDINMSGKSFSPLCENGFKGVFDGLGHTISNLEISGENGDNIAFIAVLSGGVLKNLNFDKPTIEVFNWLYLNNKTSVAVAVGEMQSGSVENVHVTDGEVNAIAGLGTNADAGGIVGTANSGSISESGGAIDISNSGFFGSSNVGGICGKITGDVTLTDVSYEGNASSIAGAGGNNVTIVTKYGALTVTEKNSVKTAVIDGAFTAADTVKIPSDIVVNSVTLNRTFNANSISTLYVPFEIAAKDVVGAKVYKFKTVVKNEEDGRWKFKVTTTETVKPNTPYVVLPESTQVSFNISESVTLNTTTPGEESSNGQWDFIGTYSYINFVLDNDNPVYLFANQECDGAKLGEFVKIATGAFTNPMRAYLVYHKTLAKSARGNLGSNILLPDELDIEIEDEKGIVVETGRFNTVTGEVRMDCWFDLKGRKLNSKPTVKGTYYNNGKKVIVK